MTKLDDLINWFEGKSKVIIALSGGVDSALVAYAAYDKLGKSALAVTADYKTLSEEELDTAKQICKEIGIPHKIIEYDELENEDFVKNDEKRCFYCRNELGRHLTVLQKKINADVVVDGTNSDDLVDYRPGIVALRNYGIRSPLAEIEFSKKDIRSTAKHVGLTIFDKPSNSCLASRIPWGQRVTAERLIRIEMGEKIVKQIANVKQVRVRDLDGVAKLEVTSNELNLITEKILKKISSKLQLFGFSSVIVDPEGYKPGKINVLTD
ncbi:MAG TPA: ATP-dependent sacrificial sulfur transferase LarE [Nitrosopumilaceae archaeon]|nr:ATP-dependent sacrificial sulfur transferase LarE [Nitrosopumilaceae archaeon]